MLWGISVRGEYIRLNLRIPRLSPPYGSETRSVLSEAGKTEGAIWGCMNFGGFSNIRADTRLGEEAEKEVFFPVQIKETGVPKRH